jgi:hypothetical protein
MSEVVHHLEKFLGETIGGWNPPEWNFYVLEFPHAPFPNCTALATAGLSELALPSRVTSKEIRHELVVVFDKSHGPAHLPSVLHQVGMEAVERNHAYLRGDVIGPRDTLVDGTQMTGFYVTLPTFAPDEFASFEAADGSHRIFAWLIPITTREAEFVREKGWNAFEDVLERASTDLFALRRGSVV